MPLPSAVPTPKTTPSWKVWMPFAALPLLAFALDPFTHKHLIFALGAACFAASVAFVIAFSAVTALPDDGKRSFAKRFGRNVGLFLLTLLCFIPLMLFLSESGVSTQTPDSPFEGMGGCTLCGFFGPLVLGFLLQEFTRSMN